MHRKASKTTRAFCVCYLLGLMLLTAEAQNAPEPTRLPPGFEMLEEASLLLQNSKALTEAMQPNATLTQKREALAGKEVVRALRLLRTWLNRPNVPTAIGPMEDIPIPFFARLRNLGRVLSIEQYVLLADGRVGAAIDSIRDGLRLSHLVKPNTMIALLVGTAVDSMVVVQLSQRLGQLSALDCERLLALARDWNGTPDPTPAMIEGEYRQTVKAVRAMRAEAENPFPALLEPSEPDPDEDDTDAAERADQKALAEEAKKLDKAAAQKLMQAVDAGVQAYYVRLQQEIRLPYWERQNIELPKPPQNDIAARMVGQIVELLIPIFHRVMDIHTGQLAKARLLGCHAAIRRYHWEHNRWPGNLDTLRLETLAIDPFTGKSLVYQVTGRTYTLACQGPPERDANGKPLPGKFKTVTLESR